MKYSVIITPDADAQLSEVYSYLASWSPLNARRWLDRFYRRIDSLENFPERRPIAPETEFYGEEMREIFEPPYRILFVIESHQIVRVIHIRHASRRYWGEPEE